MIKFKIEEQNQANTFFITFEYVDKTAAAFLLYISSRDFTLTEIQKKKRTSKQRWCKEMNGEFNKKMQ